MNKEEIMKRNIELLSFGNIETRSLSTCEIYGISGECGADCPLYQNKQCEVYEDVKIRVLEEENEQLKHQLEKYTNTYGTKENMLDMDKEDLINMLFASWDRENEKTKIINQAIEYIKEHPFEWEFEIHNGDYESYRNNLLEILGDEQ